MVFKYSEIRAISIELGLRFPQNTTIRNNVVCGKNDFAHTVAALTLAQKNAHLTAA